VKIAVYVTGMANVRFYSTFYESWRATMNPSDASLYYMMDCQTDVPRNLFQEMYSHLTRIIFYSEGAGLNQMWNECVRHAKHNAFDIAIVANDDIYLTPGWFQAIEQIFARNPHVALAGIPADGAWHDQHQAKLRWFTDLRLVTEDDHQRFRDAPAKYDPWVSGPLWACRVQPWMEHATIPRDLFFGYGEPWMGLKLFEAGHYAASVYYRTIYHYGGGMYWDVHGHPVRDQKFNSSAGHDAQHFAAHYGTSELDELIPTWRSQLETRQPPPLQFDPPETRP